MEQKWGKGNSGEEVSIQGKGGGVRRRERGKDRGELGMRRWN